MALSRASRQYLGVRAILPPDLVTANRSPTSTDKAYVKGTLWLDLSGNAAYMWNGTGTWISLSSGSAGSVTALEGDTGGPIAPVSGVIDVLGTVNQLEVSGSAGTLTLSLASSIVAPGTLTATLGDISALDGNLALDTAGNKIVIASGTNASVGLSAAMTAGAVTVSTTASSATALIFYSRATTGGTPGEVSITAQDATGFTLTSSSPTETSTFNWWIINL